MIKPPANVGLESVVDSVTYKLLIIDTTLRSFIPPKVRKMTPRLRQIFGCELCIIYKDMKICLNIYILKLASDLQQTSVGRGTKNSNYIPTSAENYK